jgi:membrane fusion protein (multidrug efflux system)
VRDGLKDGERVITIGRNAVRDGTEVTVITPPEPQAQVTQIAKALESGT